ncbi:DNA methylase [Streptomyces sp. MUSC 125]|uniref:BREX-2 system adenine-specific DNA-methyltransferase PglX n=1 Tax=Streptomyces sp. MUSC 125 TaxID=1428624 RepID=UPI00057DEC37|nr:BREX-2 system adenine-specific DNA-methyltransferase PglX [Streptomyces sp. MUSC 125]KIE25823.1 DNA methylase [Streptomyces sp. MUSC 125]
MIDRKALLDDLKQQVKAVEADLGRQVGALDEVGTRLRAEYERARKLGRTAATWNSWLDERVTQVAVAWVLGTVFVRFCEDNRLIPEPYLTGPDGDRRELAESRYDAYVESDDDPTYRGWLEKAFDELGQGQAGRLLFDKRHNPLYQIPLSHDGARELVEFWRGRDEAGVLVHDFTDPLNEDGTEGWDTRFLGDLYQDLSEAARKTYALLQTPEFVEEFILDRTMNPAVREFGYEELKMIDPTCGSGHFVLGAFRRLVRLWGEGQPGRDVHERVRAALDSVHGVDINPFAVAIARFRLLVAAMAASGVRTLGEAAKYEWPMHLAVGDSLIKARQLELTLGGDEEEDDPLASFAYATEDVHAHPGILQQGRYHVVVGNPPYITVKDKKLNALYKSLYNACAMQYALSVPFAQRFFELAKRGDTEGHGYGMVGQITANSFMKREFGTKLIEHYFTHEVELTEVIDTSGAYIPGHGTPTVILIGKRRSGTGRSTTIRTVRSVQGEPSAPDKAEEGLVWQAIAGQIDRPGSVSQWVSVGDLDRMRHFARQPWILTDGGLELNAQIEGAQVAKLSSEAESVGFCAVTREDDAYLIGATAARRLGVPPSSIRWFYGGASVREWGVQDGIGTVFPYDDATRAAQIDAATQRLLWRNRVLLRRRRALSGTQEEQGLTWFEFSSFNGRRYWSPFLIAFSFVATHNQFTLRRDRSGFIRSAPVIKLREGASEEEHLRLLGLLNSSTAGFWLKMVSHDKGIRGEGGGFTSDDWERFYEFTGTKLQEFPIPAVQPATLAAALDDLAQQLTATSPAAVSAKAAPIASVLREAKCCWESIHARMIALQEELDWQVYSLYDLHPEDLRVSEDPDAPDIPELALGERAFEIVLARRVAAGEASDEWFKRHGSTPVTEIPGHWPAPYREIVQKRIDAIESNRAIGMVERPEYKRRWATEGWDALQDKALRSWLLDRMENRELWFDENGQPAILTLARLTDALSRDEDFVSVAKLYAPRKELAKVVAELITDEHVPFLSALRYKPSGLKKRADWEEVWDLQRKEDAAPDEPAKRKIRDSIPVPPKYTSADFLRPSYWRARGKLDVPKERFVSYGQSNAATPELYGWAGWDHREQAQALATYFTNTALSTEEITPFLAGLLELQPWLGQWHNEFDMLYSGSPADFFAGYRQQKQGEHGLTDDDLRNWRPPAATRGRRAAAKK